jgi:hypothetical protein
MQDHTETMNSNPPIILPATTLLVTYASYRLLRASIKSHRSPFRDLPGPTNPSYIYGNILELFSSGGDYNDAFEAWGNKYGNTFVTKGFFNVRGCLLAGCIARDSDAFLTCSLPDSLLLISKLQLVFFIVLISTRDHYV